MSADSSPEENQEGRVEQVAQRVARREFLKRGGRFAIGATVASWFLGVAPSAFASSPSCSAVGAGCHCSNTQCYKGNGSYCTNRTGDCCKVVGDCNTNPGRQCWFEGSILCCDFYCNGAACRCCAY